MTWAGPTSEKWSVCCQAGASSPGCLGPGPSGRADSTLEKPCQGTRRPEHPTGTRRVACLLPGGSTKPRCQGRVRIINWVETNTSSLG